MRNFGGCFVFVLQDGWVPAIYKWSYSPYKWPYNWVTGLTLLKGVISLHLQLGGGPPCRNCWSGYLQPEVVKKLNSFVGYP